MAGMEAVSATATTGVASGAAECSAPTGGGERSATGEEAGRSSAGVGLMVREVAEELTPPEPAPAASVDNDRSDGAVPLAAGSDE
jgi:hypothetical protein